MTTSQQASRLMVFTTEDDRAGHQGVWEAVLERAREDGMRGATVWRGIEGFGAGGNLRTTRFPDTSPGLPVVVEIIDEPQRIDAFATVVADLAPDALVTTEPVLASRRNGTAALPLDDTPPRPR